MVTTCKSFTRVYNHKYTLTSALCLEKRTFTSLYLKLMNDFYSSINYLWMNFGFYGICFTVLATLCECTMGFSSVNNVDSKHWLYPGKNFHNLREKSDRYASHDKIFLKFNRWWRWKKDKHEFYIKVKSSQI